jgi:hypothetical protein
MNCPTTRGRIRRLAGTFVYQTGPNITPMILQLADTLLETKRQSNPRNHNPTAEHTAKQIKNAIIDMAKYTNVSNTIRMLNTDTFDRSSLPSSMPPSKNIERRHFSFSKVMMSISPIPTPRTTKNHQQKTLRSFHHHQHQSKPRRKHLSK